MNPPSELDLATRHALNILYPVSPLELAYVFLPSPWDSFLLLPPTQGDFSVMGDLEG